MEFLGYPKTPHFSSVVMEVKHLARFGGVDDNGQVIYNNDPYPTIKFKGTVKMHGSNASVVYDTETKEIWGQSKGQIVDSSHFGFRAWVKENDGVIRDLFKDFTVDSGEGRTIAIYGEWVGPGVIKGCSVAELKEKIFIIFGAKVRNHNDDSIVWVATDNLRSENNRIFNITEFPTFEIDIDFKEPKLYVNKMVDITNAVEESCPVAKHFGFDAIGEGVVWVANYKEKRLVFKVKGAKHSNNKTKNLAPVDMEKLESIKEAVDFLFTENRLDQAIHETGVGLDKKHTGDVLRWICNDIMTEENNTLESNGLTWKDIAGNITGKYRDLFFEKIDSSIF